MNGKVDYFKLKIKHLAPRIDLNVMSGLLIIRYVSKEFIPPYTQLEIETISIFGSESIDTYEQTAWDTVIRARSGEYIEAIISGLHLVWPQYSLLRTLEDAIRDVQPDEQDLREIIELLSYISLDDISLAEIYEYRLSREIWPASSSSGGFHTPVHVARLLSGLLDIKEGSVYDPCCGSGSILCQAGQAAQLRLYGQTADQYSYLICETISILRNLSINLGGKPANTLTEDLHVGWNFDYILTNIPFNLSHWYDGSYPSGDTRWQYGFPPGSNANFAMLQHIVSHLEDNGQAAVIMPNGTLTTQVRAELSIRQGLLNDGLVEVVIALPAGIFHNTKIPCCIWILNKSKTHRSTTLLIDARDFSFKGDGKTIDQTGSKLRSLILQHRNGTLQGKTDWYAVASTEEISQKRYSLSPNLYTETNPIPWEPIRQNQARLIALIDTLCVKVDNDVLLPLIRQWKNTERAKRWEKAVLPELYQISGGLAKKKSSFGHGTEMVNVKTVIHHSFLPDTLTSLVDATEQEIQKYQIKAGDILLNRTSESVEQLACCCIVPTDRRAVYDVFTKCLRPRNDGVPNPFYLAGYFRSAIYRQEVKKGSPVYTTRANMNMDRLSEISIYYPDVAAQDKLGKTLFTISQYQNECKDKAVSALLKEFEQLLIEQFITYPILRNC